MAAPVCHIPPVPPATTQPTGTRLPSIPAATDLSSALRAIAAMRQAIQQLSNQITKDNGVINGFRQDRNQGATWTEDSRVTETVRVTNPQDENQYVDVERINSLSMKNRDTGQTWKWKR